MPENNEAAMKDFADLLANFLNVRIDAFASNLAALLPHSALFEIMRSTKPIVKSFILNVLVFYEIQSRRYNIQICIEIVCRK